MVTVIGNVTAFTLQNDFQIFQARLEQFFTANVIEETRKAAILLTFLGDDAYKLVQDLCVPVLPKEKSYDELVTLMGDHLLQKKSIFSERYKFHRAHQEENETIAQYSARIMRLSTDCKFGTNLQESLRDKLITGLRRGHALDKFLSMATAEQLKLTFNDAISIAAESEAVRSYTNIIQNDAPSTHSQVNLLKNKDYTKTATTSQGSREGLCGNKANGRRSLQPSSKPGEPRGSQRNYVCYACGETGHDFKNCKFKGYTCLFCKKKGHIKKICKAFARQGGKHCNTTNYLGRDLSNTDSVNDVTQCFHMVNGGTSEHFMMKVLVENREFLMEVDTGSGVSAVPLDIFRKEFNQCINRLQPTSLILTTYVGEKITPKGKVQVEVRTEVTHKPIRLDLYVIERGESIIMGRDWLRALHLLPRFTAGKESGNPKFSINSLQSKIDYLMDRFKSVFSNNLGCFTGPPLEFRVDEGAVPRFVKHRPIPFALREKVETEINRLLKEKVLSPVENSAWATPIVPVIKDDNTVRICGDYKITVNPVLENDNYPLPQIEQLFTKLHKGKKFTKLDMRSAFNQVTISEESKRLVTISTHLGLFTYNSAPFGIKTLPSKFQKLMDGIIDRVPSALVVMDDILITGKDDDDHLRNLEAVLKILQEWGFTLRRDKCRFFQEEVEYMGFVIDQEGLHTAPSKVEAINRAPTPTDIKQLRSFLGLVNFYGKFVPGLSTVLQPMFSLLKKDRDFDFDKKCQESFARVKALLTKAPVLTHFNPDLPLKLTCDSSEYGLGAILAHVALNGSENPIAYASRTLTKAERGYSQIHKEALAIVYGISKFSQYLYLKHFTLVTDHKPLISIFGPKNGLPTITANRLQRYALFLAGFDYEIQYIKGELNYGADCLSRLPIPGGEGPEEGSTIHIHINYMFTGPLPIAHKDVKQATLSDDVLVKVMQYMKLGWPRNEIIDPRFRYFYQKKDQLSIEAGCVFWGFRLVIPSQLRSPTLQLLHEGHLGVVKMKGLARSYVWWPNIDLEIEEITKNCGPCALESDDPPKCRNTSWNETHSVWDRVHVDFLGPFLGKIFLVCTDSYSKWVEVQRVASTSAENTIGVLMPIFARFGLPKHVVSDNGPPFTSSQFGAFLRELGIKHTLIPSYHPASNGLAENSVRYFKRKLKTATHDPAYDLDIAMFKLLFQYRNAIHCTTKESPAQRMFKRNLRTKLDLMLPNLGEPRELKVSSIRTTFRVGDQVFARDFRPGKKWSEGRVVRQLSPLTYRIVVDTNRVWKRHTDQLRERRTPDKEIVQEQPDRPIIQKEIAKDGSLGETVNSQAEETLRVSFPTSVCPPSVEGNQNRESQAEETGTPKSEEGRRYPERIRRAPHKLDL